MVLAAAAALATFKLAHHIPATATISIDKSPATKLVVRGQELQGVGHTELLVRQNSCTTAILSRALHVIVRDDCSICACCRRPGAPGCNGLPHTYTTPNLLAAARCFAAPVTHCARTAPQRRQRIISSSAAAAAAHVSRLRWCIKCPSSRLSSTHFVKSGAVRPSCSARCRCTR